MAYERTLEGLLEAIEDASRMRCSDQVKYFGIDCGIKSRAEGLWLIIATADAKTIFNGMELYYKDKEIEKEIQTRAKVKKLVDDVGIHNVLSIAREMLMTQEGED